MELSPDWVDRDLCLADADALRPLVKLALWVLDETRRSDLNGGDIQDKAEALGILEQVEVSEPWRRYYDSDEWPAKYLRASALVEVTK